jgi:hypothetical protein
MLRRLHVMLRKSPGWHSPLAAVHAAEKLLYTSLAAKNHNNGVQNWVMHSQTLDVMQPLAACMQQHLCM